MAGLKLSSVRFNSIHLGVHFLTTGVANNNIATLKVTCYEKVAEAPKWMLLGENICFSASGDQHGTMQLDVPIVAYKFKLTHRSGVVSCKAGDKTSSYWGCWPDNPLLQTLITTAGMVRVFGSESWDCSRCPI
jgi:hypothetical protein